MLALLATIFLVPGIGGIAAWLMVREPGSAGVLQAISVAGGACVVMLIVSVLGAGGAPKPADPR